MCLGDLYRRVITPTPKLTNMLCLLKILLVLNLVCGIMRIIYKDYQSFFIDLLTSCILMCALSNNNYASMAMYLLLCMLNEVMIFFQFGLEFQSIIQNQIKDNYKFMMISFMFFIIVFYIVACWRAFVTYREMKALYFEQIIGVRNPDQERLRQDQENIPPQQNPPIQYRAPQASNSNQGQSGFQAFSGRGYVVGG